VKHGLVAPYPAQNQLTPEQADLLRGRYQGTAPDSFPSYVVPQNATMPDTAEAPVAVDSLMADSLTVDSLKTDSTKSGGVQ
jgi:hypothetical protein